MQVKSIFLLTNILLNKVNQTKCVDMSLGKKALGCFGGCDLHGIKNNVQWTQLALTVDAGSSNIILQESVDWNVGDKIVVTTTSYS